MEEEEEEAMDLSLSLAWFLSPAENEAGKRTRKEIGRAHV